MTKVLEEYKDAAWARKPGGAVIVDGIEVANSMMCCHCGNHFLSVKGSGVTRGFCTRCMAVTCGCAGCMECYPFSQRLDDYEKGKLSRL